MSSKQTLASIALMAVIILSGVFIWRTVQSKPFLAAEVGATSVTVTSPSGGEEWKRGSLESIRWEATPVEEGSTPSMTIELRPAGEGQSYTLSIDAQQAFEWVVGEYIGVTSLFEIPNAAYTIRICATGTTVCDQSERFTLSTPEIVPVIWGQEGDEPEPADYSGDGKTDLAVWRPKTGKLWVQYHGMFDSRDPSEKKPANKDFNGDGSPDPVIWDNTTRIARILGQTIDLSGLLPAGTYVPVPGDYDGNGRAELALFKPGQESSATWFIYTKEL